EGFLWKVWGLGGFGELEVCVDGGGKGFLEEGFGGMGGDGVGVDVFGVEGIGKVGVYGGGD
ncbi:hypothetical protein, partial [Neisseria sicca]|uniref:hypothetical protein n=1 Tax=Neisseria sicca TaxID=490 RepID=UPI001C99410C